MCGYWFNVWFSYLVCHNAKGDANELVFDNKISSKIMYARADFVSIYCQAGVKE